MEISTKELRIQPGRVISMVRSGQNVTITYRGKPSARIVSISNNKNNDIKVCKNEDEAFGLWKDRENIGNIDQYVRNMRKGRVL